VVLAHAMTPDPTKPAKLVPYAWVAPSHSGTWVENPTGLPSPAGTFLSVTTVSSKVSATPCDEHLRHDGPFWVLGG